MAEQTLNDIMEFGHLIRVREGGVIEDDYKLQERVKFYAPESVDVSTDGKGNILDAHDKAMIEELKGQGWSFMDGYSGQQGYSGPIMHRSEFIGGGLERDIREQPGYYVAVTVETDDEDEEPAGWAVLYRES